MKNENVVVNKKYVNDEIKKIYKMVNNLVCSLDEKEEILEELLTLQGYCKIGEITPKRYLLEVTFYADSDEPEDIDKGLYLLTINKEISKKEMEEIFKKVNGMLDPYAEEDEKETLPVGFPTYDNGLNIDILMEGVEKYIGGSITGIPEGRIVIDDKYIIEQWQ